MIERRIEITEEMMRGAESYLSLTAKEAIVRTVLPGCVKRIFDYDYDKGEYQTETDDLPTTMPMYGEDTAFKSRVVLGTVLHFYLGLDIGENLSIEPDMYDQYAGSHIMNQIERFKANPELKAKAFDMLADIRDFEKRLNCAVYSLLQLKNDVGGRVLAALSAMMSQEALENVIRATSEAQAGIAEEKERQDAFIESLEEQEGDGDEQRAE